VGEEWADAAPPGCNAGNFLALFARGDLFDEIDDTPSQL
jgi:hypothetical protein